MIQCERSRTICQSHLKVLITGSAQDFLAGNFRPGFSVHRFLLHFPDPAESLVILVHCGPEAKGKLAGATGGTFLIQQSTLPRYNLLSRGSQTVDSEFHNIASLEVFRRGHPQGYTGRCAGANDVPRQ